MQKSLRFICIIVELSLVVTVVLGSVSATAEAATVDRVLATVNNEAVTLSDYKRFLLRLGSFASSEKVDNNILKNLINDRLVFNEAKRSGIDVTEPEISQIIKEFKESDELSDDEFKKGLAEEGLTIADFRTFLREKIISLKFIDREVNSKIAVTDKDIEEYYNNNLKLFTDRPERMLIGAIFVKLPPNATLTEVTDLKLKSLKIISELKSGRPFGEMNSLYSSEPVRSDDGLLGEFEKWALTPELDFAVSPLKEGEISEPVWTKEGVYILKLVRKIQANHVPLDQVKEQIFRELYRQKRELAFDEWVKALWEKTSVSIKE